MACRNCAIHWQWTALLAIALSLSTIARSRAEHASAGLERLPPVPLSQPRAPVTTTAAATPVTPLVAIGPNGNLSLVDFACDDCLDPRTGWLDNLSVFMGLDGSKQPQDFGINAQFGGRAAVNWAMPVWEAAGLGVQLGTAIDATGDAVQVMQRTAGTSGRVQSFTTVGFFQRNDNGFNWGVVYDFLAENYYDQFSLGQWRINLAYRLTPCNTIGVWSAIGDHSDSGTYNGIPVTLSPITQTNTYLKHEWAGGIQTTGWTGLANGHGQVNAVLGDLNRLRNTFVFGAEIYVPLTDHLAMFGQGNFIMPADSGTVDSYLGFVYYPHGGVRGAMDATFAPLQTVAAPTNFAVDLRRQ